MAMMEMTVYTTVLVGGVVAVVEPLRRHLSGRRFERELRVGLVHEGIRPR
jgi:hypothetical protein